jgi:hypothetical protein
MSTPIINIPQSAILGMHKIQERPVVVDGQVVVRPMMYVALSYDHRIIDGRESVSFLVRVKELLEKSRVAAFWQRPAESLAAIIRAWAFEKVYRLQMCSLFFYLFADASSQLPPFGTNHFIAL